MLINYTLTTPDNRKPNNENIDWLSPFRTNCLSLYTSDGPKQYSAYRIGIAGTIPCQELYTVPYFLCLFYSTDKDNKLDLPVVIVFAVYVTIPGKASELGIQLHFALAANEAPQMPLPVHCQQIIAVGYLAPTAPAQLRGRGLIIPRTDHGHRSKGARPVDPPVRMFGNDLCGGLELAEDCPPVQLCLRSLVDVCSFYRSIHSEIRQKTRIYVESCRF